MVGTTLPINETTAQQYLGSLGLKAPSDPALMVFSS